MCIPGKYWRVLRQKVKFAVEREIGQWRKRGEEKRKWEN
jgi:hypothetical protein